MSIVSCQSCEAAQPKEWQAGQLCVQCGGTVREEKRCGWCACWTPKGKFCRECGSGLIDDDHFGAARMLKQAGVDQFTLPERLQAMEPEQIQHFQRLYQKHYAIVIRFLDEVDRCQQDLVQQHFSAELESELVKQLPYDEQALAQYNKNYAQPLSEKQLQLAFIAEHSPHELTQQLALLASLQSGQVANEHESLSQAHIEKVLALLDHEDEKIALEAAISLTHWSFYLPVMQASRESRLSRQDRLLEISESYRFDNRLALWAAVISCTAQSQQVDEFKSELQQGLLSEHDNLRFSCALLLKEAPVLRQYLSHSNEQMRDVAVVQLARHAPQHLAGDLGQLSDRHLSAVLSSLAQPVPASLITPILDIIVDPQQALRNEALNLLVPQLDDVQLHTLLNRVESGRDDDLFFALISESVFHPALLEVLLDKGLADLAEQPQGDMIANYLYDHSLKIINSCTPLWSRVVDESYDYLLSQMLNAIDYDDVDNTSAILDTFYRLAQRDYSSLRSAAVSVILERFGEQDLLNLLPAIKQHENQELAKEILHRELSLSAEIEAKHIAVSIGFIEPWFLNEELVAECIQHDSSMLVELLETSSSSIIDSVLTHCINVLNEQPLSPGFDILSAFIDVYKNRDQLSDGKLRHSEVESILDLILTYTDLELLDELVTYAESTQNKELLQSILEFYGPNSRLQAFPREDLDKSSAIISALASGMDWSLLWDAFCRHSVIPASTFWRLIELDDTERLAWCVRTIYLHLDADKLEDEAAHEYFLMALYIMSYVSQFPDQDEYASLQSSIVDLFDVHKPDAGSSSDLFDKKNLQHYSAEHKIFIGISGLMHKCGMSAPDNLSLWLNELLKNLVEHKKLLQSLDPAISDIFIAAINELRHNVDFFDDENIELDRIDALLSILQPTDECAES